MEQIHHIHHNFPTRAGRLAGVFKKRHPSSLSKKVRTPLSPLCEGDSPQRGEMSRSDRGAWARRAPPAGGGGENCTAARNISGYGKVLSLRPFGAPPSQRCVHIHDQPFHENQHRHILLADFSAPIFHFQKNVNLRKIHEVDYAEKDCNNCCSLFGETSGFAVWPMPFPQITSNSSVLAGRPFALTVTVIFPGASPPRTTANALP